MASGWHIHVYAGQSNECEVGLGPWTDTSSAYDSRIFQVGRQNGDGQIIPAARPLDYWVPGRGHGSGLSRARLYIANGQLPDGFNLLIVPAAKPSTSVLHWDGTVPDPDGDDLWGDMIARTNIGLGLPQSSVSLFVWRQIEADVDAADHVGNSLHAQMPDAHTWYNHTSALMLRVRDAMPECAISYTHPTEDFVSQSKWAARFKLAQEYLAATMPRSTVTQVGGLGSNAPYVDQGYIHFSADSEEQIAARNIADVDSLPTNLVANFTGAP